MGAQLWRRRSSDLPHQGDYIITPYSWFISADSTRMIGPPIYYGTIPRGTTATWDEFPESLVSGEKYTVKVAAVTGDVLAELTFTR